MADWRTRMEELPVGKGRMISEGEELAILTVGHVGNYAKEVVRRFKKEEGLDVGHYDMRFVKPLDEDLLHQICKNYKYLITVEDGCLMGGFGSAVLEFMADNDYFRQLRRLGIPDQVVEHGEQIELQAESGFDPEGIYTTAISLLQPAVI